MTEPSALRNLGRTGLSISAIGLGCWQFSRGRGFGARVWTYVKLGEAEEIVRLSLEGGANWFDTAEAYGFGESERVLARSLKNLKRAAGSVVIATKWFPIFRWASSLAASIGRRLENLDGYPIDLYQVHNPYSFSRVETEMAAMASLVNRGQIGHVGVSNFSASQMRRAAAALGRFGLSLASNQVRYSLLDRRIETNGVLDAARELGVTIIAYSPLAQGLLSGKFHDDPGRIRKRAGYRRCTPAFRPRAMERSRPLIEAVKTVALRHRASPSQVALSWVIHNQGTIVAAIPGATTPKQAGENIEALGLQLSPEELNELTEVSTGYRS